MNILSIAGSDPSGGAGIQADLKTIAANGGYGMAVIAALTAQNTLGVSGVQAIGADFVTAQLEAISADVRIDAVKIGMLANQEIIDAVAAWLDAVSVPVVLDPVMVATSGDALLEDAAALHPLLARATVITPNTAELGALLGVAAAQDWSSALDQAQRLAAAHDVLVLAKGGHLSGAQCPDALVSAAGVLAEFTSRRHATKNTHGTGCTLSSALATRFAATGDWAAALEQAKGYLDRAIGAADQLQVGSGHGPVHHFVDFFSAADPMAAWWEDIAPLRSGIDELAFIVQLADGTLEREKFEYYLAQDALYLQRYAQVLAQASALAPELDSQRFWASGAGEILEGELQLHRGRLVEGLANPSATTLNYVNHLASCNTSYPELIAAILPCYWLYQDIGKRLAAANHEGHPYGDWLQTYASEEFDASTAQAIEMVRDAWMLADAGQRERMRQAFLRSSEHELAFFAQAHAESVEFSTA
ncbi:bifunctional hydroxymethylpyrimidine kinase/phosphomethylpyrimidine kinase [Glutamicibacter protophormiae]|uniref:bifunctional hydroxymethylpyrimidine kinase/phosphomethylpyrimidine kinase n=1 Tax=Glutamicibacter protophormiae TaxID=37930 RepID=UPI002A808D02|nr:bifunctional hydroxymethylpyrimidine kinase/phosphomethylpyrimidine kinase [Glutamicibacter protophormiae]WPR64816.1 bifunctional hydroxymethylpyrimidine kinase/phosphomethylpyrimidine kinase [Glutamicibacter protophormiae]WPR68312.1 bifunctional hydroxymethylpyrimidine kinase/phosphomethylpyrimidine kinase [Glutamicibacter protophormiae]